MRVTPVAIGLMVSYLSAISLLGVSSETYVYGTQYAVINISYGLATLIAVYFYLPVFYRLHATSAFEVRDGHWPLLRSYGLTLADGDRHSFGLI